MSVAPPRVSIVINTDGRAKALRETIESFRHLDYPAFEVCVVYGPTPDGTKEYAESLAGRVKVRSCPVRNLSQSRNIGIAMAAGDIVAFIDDDGIPEPEWLTELAPAFNDHAVGGAGGVVYDHTGYEFQYLYAGCDRMGNAITNAKEPFSEYCYPFSSLFPYVQGTNSAFSRKKLVSIGGFDEEYEFYLDETDVCCRMVDAGYTIAQLPNARVHHKFLPSSIRNEGRITVKKFAVMKNKIYFSLICNRGHHGMSEIIADNARFIEANRNDLAYHIGLGNIDHAAIDAFDQDAEMAWRIGLSRGLSGTRRTRDASYFANPAPFLNFTPLAPEGGKRTFVFMCQSYPPADMGGTARYTHDIAQAIGELGHNVHVLTRGSGHNRVDLEGDAWVHRIVPRAHAPRSIPSTGETIPQHIVDYSETMLGEIHRINASRKVDVVEAVSWDCEAAAPLLDGFFPTATNVVTSLAHWLESHDTQKRDSGWMANFGRPMLALEREIYTTSPRIIAASRAIAASLQESHNFAFRADQVAYCPHGLADMAPMSRRRPGGLSEKEGRTAILFVGRLELRKGIDTLLEAAPHVLGAHADVEFWIAGDDTLVIDGGQTARARFEASEHFETVGDRVKFLGPVSDEELRWLYANCTIFAAPSRFESFGLIFVEAYMFGKPVVGCSAGAIPEVVREGVDGLLCPPGDSTALADALIELLYDEAQREAFGKAGREAFDTRFSAAAVAPRRAGMLLELRREIIPPTEWRITPEAALADITFGLFARSLRPEGSMEFDCDAPFAYVTFFQHAWSGLAVIEAPGSERITKDLFAKHPRMVTVRIALPAKGGVVRVRRAGGRGPSAEGDEVMVVNVAKGAY